MSICKITFKRASLLGLALALALLAPHRAAADDDDPPSRVARLSYTHGPVSFEPAGTDDWLDAIVNRPITTGDKLWNDSGARSELNIGSASIRLGSTTGFSFLNLTDNTVQLRLTEGTLNIRVRNLGDDETFEVDTPNLAFTVLRPGNYKINVNEGGDSTLVVVRDGQGEVTGGGQAFAVHPHEVGTFDGNDQINADLQAWDYGTDDDFDNWSADRDRHVEHSVSARYVSTDVIGYEDLDDNGGWRQVPEYGTVWFPHTTIVGWAPYHYGHWAYIAPWGYTWVDDAPWGFAPFHYGRWVFVGGVWGWVPVPPRPVAVVGVAYVRPVYAPALVAWVGGPHFGVGIGVGGGIAAGVNVGWFPLGPREVYVPSYPVSRTYVNNVNVSNTTVNTTVVNNYYNTTVINRNTAVNNTAVNNVTVNNQHYMNQSVPGAVTATNARAFTSAQPVARNVVEVNQREVAAAPVVAMTPSVAPNRQAVLGTGAIAAAHPPAALQDRAVVAKTPPPPPPVSFVRQQQAIQENGGRPLAISQERHLQPEVAQVPRPTVKIAPPSQPATPQNVQVNRPTGQPGAPAMNNNPNRPNVPANVAAQPSQGNMPSTPANNASNNTQKAFGDRPQSSRPVGVNPVGQQQQQDPQRQKVQQQQQQDRLEQLQQQRDAANKQEQQLEQKHQQQLEQLHQQQDQERQKVERQQQQDRLRLQQQTDAAKQAQLNQQHQQQQDQERLRLQQQGDAARQSQLNQQHQQQLEQLRQQHVKEQQKLDTQQRQEHANQNNRPPSPPPNPPKDNKPPKDEKPHGK
jgi:hypothetical protein